MKNFVVVAIAIVSAVLISSNSAFAFGNPKATAEEIKTAEAAYKAAIKDRKTADEAVAKAEAALASASAEAKSSAEAALASASEEAKLKAEEEDKAKEKYFGLKKDTTSLPDALVSFCLSLLLYAVGLAIGHFIGSFFDPIIGIAICIAISIFALYTITSLYCDYCYIGATTKLVALAIAAYIHFTKVITLA